ncbi:hypothetical protein, partial [Priestia megaterium]|uniref:hypothetical protein n=1 Tax=Priestia megaterium TaxID=1404 RepID=UPI0035B659EE
FTIIDISYDAMGSASTELCRNNDLTNFKQHIWRLLSAQRASVPRSSLRKYIGTRSYRLVERIMSENTTSFAEVRAAIDDTAGYDA